MAVDQREALIASGLEIVHRHGFGATGVREIAAAAQVPQGSFTNHFRSKDAFGLLILDRYVERLDAVMDETLGNAALAPQQRLLAYFDRIEASVASAEWQQGCMVVDLAAEMAVHSELLRERLCAVLQHQTARFEAVVRLIGAHADDDLAGFILAAWHGSLLRMKTERDAGALRRFRQVLARLLSPEP